MLSLLKSDIYKIFKRMSFYVCMILVALSAGYSTWTQEQTEKMKYKAEISRYAAFMDVSEMYEKIDAMSGKDMGITAWTVLMNSLPLVILFSGIFLTIFISSEFSSGMCKTLLIRGKNRISVYISKLISCSLVSIIYSLVVCALNFGIGASKWQGFEWKNEYLNDYIIPFGWFLLVAITWQALLCMTTFICRGSGMSMAVNLGLMTILPGAILLGLKYIAINWFNKTNVPFSDYWIGSYDQVCLWGVEGKKFTSEIINPLIWTLVCWFIVPTLIGMLVFRRREVK